MAAYGHKPGWVHRLGGPALRLFRACMRLVHERLARRVAHHIVEYERAGFTVVAVAGEGLFTAALRRRLERSASATPSSSTT